MRNDKERMLELAKAMGLDICEVGEDKGGFFIENSGVRKKLSPKDTVDLFYTQDELDVLKNNEFKRDSVNKDVTFAKKAKVVVSIRTSFFTNKNIDNSKVVA